MKFYINFLVQLTLFGVAILPITSAGGNDCCRFTLSSKGLFSCPARQLPDGQIRLNGSEPESTFCLDSKGGITDQNSNGCIVTGAPTTQVQCDASTSPDNGFSIDSSNNLEYKGSSSFFACPATDTEYNIYVAPNFGQTKCFPITLQASGCQAQNSTSSTCAALTVTSIVTQMQTVTDSPSTVTQTITQTKTETDSKSWTQTLIFNFNVFNHDSAVPKMQHDDQHNEFYEL
ncbi:uncharacterized protein PAC_13508 [Phialocephala subalpina]|uniref:Cell wall mannoprotein PIR1-like C-terminal domain-containing protein n=1 Tax=Phialocephala subalpina TaxID=576137 RepID=A0A1L7XF08_9HELO|nr:uncharacterized protein PAC_13508 [Phialocephala subalpina]